MPQLIDLVEIKTALAHLLEDAWQEWREALDANSPNKAAAFLRWELLKLADQAFRAAMGIPGD